jgi:hypothetical protein
MDVMRVVVNQLLIRIADMVRPDSQSQPRLEFIQPQFDKLVLRFRRQERID